MNNSQLSTFNFQLIRVAIVDDHKSVAEGFEHIIIESGVAEVIGKAYSVSGCREMLTKIKPDVLLLDVSMPDGSGTELCRKLLSQYPELKIIILTSHYEPVIIKQSLDAGALGYILKNAMSEEIIEGIQVVASGERFLCEETSKLLKRHENDTIVLTRREQELLRLVVAGKSSNEIADCMYLSFETIRTYRRNLMLKLNVNNTAQLVKMAMEQQLV